MAQGQVAQAGGGDIRRGGRPISGAIGVAMQDHEMRPPVLRGVKARQGGQLPITKRGTGDGAVAQVQCFDLGRRESMHLAGPGIAPVRAVGPMGSWLPGAIKTCAGHSARAWRNWSTVSR